MLFLFMSWREIERKWTCYCYLCLCDGERGRDCQVVLWFTVQWIVSPCPTSSSLPSLRPSSPHTYPPPRLPGLSIYREISIGCEKELSSGHFPPPFQLLPPPPPPTSPISHSSLTVTLPAYLSPPPPPPPPPPPLVPPSPPFPKSFPLSSSSIECMAGMRLRILQISFSWMRILLLLHRLRMLQPFLKRRLLRVFFLFFFWANEYCNFFFWGREIFQLFLCK